MLSKIWLPKEWERVRERERKRDLLPGKAFFNRIPVHCYIDGERKFVELKIHREKQTLSRNHILRRLKYPSLCFCYTHRVSRHIQPSTLNGIPLLSIYIHTKPNNYLFFLSFFCVAFSYRVASIADVVRVTFCWYILVTGGASNSLDAFRNKPIDETV